LSKPVRVLLIGTYGFIGSEIAGAAFGRGMTVVGLGRDIQLGARLLPDVTWVHGDLCDMAQPEMWLPLLNNIDAIVNASGLLQDGDGGSVTAVQRDAIKALIVAAERAGIGRFIQISAAGASSNRSSEFMASKAAADAFLAQSTLNHVILRPGLVIGRNSYGGTRLIRMAAAIPFRLELDFGSSIQCVAMNDLVDAVLTGIALPKETSVTVDLVEGEARSLPEIIAMHRRWLGLKETRVRLSVPSWTMTGASWLANAFGRLGWRSPLRRNALLALRQGVIGDTDATERYLSRRPASIEEILAANPAGIQDRVFARIDLLLPLMLASLVIMWAASGLATLVRLDDAIDIVVQGGVGRSPARLIAIIGAIVDLGLAAALLWRRTVRASLLLMIFLTIFIYLAGGTILLPHLWTDPLAPFAKAIPAAMLALVAWAALEKR
jgi:uncharacterized protein YbjT (DUF2867 family)